MSNKKTAAAKPAARAPAASRDSSIIVGILPLSADEKSITRSASRCLAACATSIRAHLGELKTPESFMAFWSSLAGWSERNRLIYATGGAAPAAPAPPAPKHGIKTRKAGTS
jgi:hypothetical protein